MIFEKTDRVATETQLPSAFTDPGFEIGGANNAAVAIAERPSVDAPSRDPFTYRYVGAPSCSF